MDDVSIIATKTTRIIIFDSVAFCAVNTTQVRFGYGWQLQNLTLCSARLQFQMYWVLDIQIFHFVLLSPCPLFQIWYEKMCVLDEYMFITVKMAKQLDTNTSLWWLRFHNHFIVSTLVLQQRPFFSLFLVQGALTLIWRCFVWSANPAGVCWQEELWWDGLLYLECTGNQIILIATT